MRCRKRLVTSGLIKLITARVAGQKGQSKKRESNYVKCIRLLRDPTDADRKAFISKKPLAQDELDAEGYEDADFEPDDTVEVGAVDVAEANARVLDRVAPQWTPSIPHTQFIYNLVHSRGSAGISTMDLNHRGLGIFWKRPLDEAINRLTNLWTVSQPPHLRHLAIVRDTNIQGKYTHYQYRSYPNFQKAVDEGHTSWAALDDIVIHSMPAKSSDLNALDETTLDQWGFPTVEPSRFQVELPNRILLDGTASLAQCRDSAEGCMSRDTDYAAKKERKAGKSQRKHALYSVLNESAPARTPKKPSSKSQPTSDRRKSTQPPATPQPASDKEAQTAATLLSSRLVRTRAEALALVYPFTFGSAKRKAKDKQGAEQRKEWEKRARRTAETLAKLEILSTIQREPSESTIETPTAGTSAITSPGASEVDQSSQSTPMTTEQGQTERSKPATTTPSRAMEVDEMSQPESIATGQLLKRSAEKAALNTSIEMGKLAKQRRVGRGRPTKASQGDQKARVDNSVTPNIDVGRLELGERVWNAQSQRASPTAETREAAGHQRRPSLAARLKCDTPKELGSCSAQASQRADWTALEDQELVDDVPTQMQQVFATSEHKNHQNDVFVLDFRSPQKEKEKADAGTVKIPSRKPLKTKKSLLPPVSGASIPSEKRIREIEQEILDVSRPGVYINPPGARELKTAAENRTGRPRNVLIACFKLDKLKELAWFSAEEDALPQDPTSSLSRATMTSVADVRTRASTTPAPDLGTNGSTISFTPVNASGSTQPLRVIPAKGATPAHIAGTGNRRYRCVVAGCDKAYKNPNGLLYHSQHGHEFERLCENADGTMSVIGPADNIPMSSTKRRRKEVQYRRLLSSLEGASTSQTSNATRESTSVQRAEPTFTVPLPSGMPPTEQQILPAVQQLPPAEYVRTSSALTASPGQRPNIVLPDAAPLVQEPVVPQDPLPSIEEPANEEPSEFADPKAAATYTPVEVDTDVVMLDSPLLSEESSMMWWQSRDALQNPSTSAWDADHPTELSAPPQVTHTSDEAQQTVILGQQGTTTTTANMVPPKPQKRTVFDYRDLPRQAGGRQAGPRKVGVPRSGGTISHHRIRIMHDILQRCDGIFPGDRELWYPFATEWEKVFKVRPDRHTVDRISRNMVQSGAIRRIAFVFETDDGKKITKHIITETGVDANSPAVRELRKKMIERFPQYYVPGHLDIAPDLKKMLTNYGSHGNKLNEEHSFRPTIFPIDDGVEVRRLNVQPGTVEDKIAAASAARKRKREENERLLREYLAKLARGEAEEANEAQKQLEGTFQVKNYEHEPKRARIDRGQHGRKHISRLLKLDRSSEPKPRSLGVLTRRRRRREECVDRFPFAVDPTAQPTDITFNAPHQVARVTGSSTRAKITPSSTTLERREQKVQRQGLKFQHKGPADFDPNWDKAQVLTLTNPVQSFHAPSGTFGTDPVLNGSVRHLFWEYSDPVDRFRKHLPTSMTDVENRVEERMQSNKLRIPDDPSYSRFEEEIFMLSKWEDKLVKVPEWDNFEWLQFDKYNFINHAAPTSFVAASDKVDVMFDNPESELYSVVNVPVSEENPDGKSLAMYKRPKPRKAPKLLRTPKTSIKRTPQKESNTVLATSTLTSTPTVLEGRARALPPPPTGPQYGVSGVLVPTSFAALEPPTPGTKRRPGRPPSAAKQKQPPAAKNELKGRRKQMQRYIPRASRGGIFAFNDAELHRLIVVIVVVRSLVGGLDQQINWGMVAQCFHYKFDPNYCRNKWAAMRAKRTPTVETLQVQFRQRFAEAYENGEFQNVDFAYPESIDWDAIVDWAENNLDSGKAQSDYMGPLLEDRKALDDLYDVRSPKDVHTVDKEEFYGQFTTSKRRGEMMDSYTYAVPVQKRKLRHEEEDPLMLAKSWVRANIITLEEDYDKQAAHVKLTALGDKVVNDALHELLGDQILRNTNRGRPVPGRNYELHDALILALKRPWELDLLQKAAAFKTKLDEDLAAAPGAKLEWNYHAKDHEIMVIENLIASGRLEVSAVLPPSDLSNTVLGKVHTEPRISKWGFTEGHYKTMHMDKEKLHWRVEFRKTDKYVNGNPLKIGEVPPPTKLQVEGEVGERIPLWTDFNGECVQNYWNIVMVSMLYFLVFKSGLTAEGISKALKGKLWVWEVELWMWWAEKAGIARRMDYGAEQDGWSAAEWWYLAMDADSGASRR